MKTMRLNFHLSVMILTSICGSALSQPNPQTESPRKVINLDGQWHIAEGNWDKPAGEYKSTAPVPGLVDMAKPPLAQFDSATSEPAAYWYRRTFTVDGEIPEVATLKINKAAYGSQVILNGQAQENRWQAFTPLYTDVKDILKPGENELVIKVGGHARLMPPGSSHSLDPEKIKYTAGLFDSVELILAGTPKINNVQTVPDIEKKTVHVYALLANSIDADREASVKFTVREHKSGRQVGSGEARVMLPPNNDETTASASITIEDCQLWSPENPFLYDVTVDTGADRVTERFGMRSFRLDQATGRAMLNGKPYFLRGSNITLYRFFEDESRGSLPWNKDWVRGLHQKVKGMHWNSLRYCIGFPPEFWYDIADEEGILIQDEFPLWNSRHGNIPNDNDLDNLANEFTNWMRERWNHPCVVIWDAQNETHSEVTGQAISAVRGLDLSNRPWDNGYGKYRLPGDSYESHPYLFNKRGFTIEDLGRRTGTPLGNAGGPNINDNPVIINEYAWLWLNRDGSPTSLSRPVYARLLRGKKASADEYRLLYARLLAQLTEFWRSHRACAGVLHFCILGYSRPLGGQTSDHFVDIENLELEQHFMQYVRDSFAPVGLMIDFHERRVNPGARLELGVPVINDLDKEWAGEVRLKLLRDGEIVDEQVQNCIVPAWGRNELLYPVSFPRRAGEYQLQATLIGAGGEAVSSWRDVRVGQPTADDMPTTAGLAVGKTAEASAYGSDELAPSLAFDGDLETRWAATPEVPAWLKVDLGAVQEVSAVELMWENAFARKYYIETSLDGETWVRVHETEDGYGAEPIIRFAAHPARFVRLTATERGTPWGVSLWEMKVF